MTMKTILIPIAFIASLFSSFGNDTLSTTRKIHLPVSMDIPAAAQDLPTDYGMKTLDTDKTASMAAFTQTYQYEFVGTVLSGDKPCPYARVDLRVISKHDNRHFQGRADENGRYTFAVSLDSVGTNRRDHCDLFALRGE
jgi:hypothetical protein